MSFGLHILCALYAEILGFEIMIVLAGRTHNDDKISAWVGYQNFNGLLYQMGLGFGNVCRTNCGNYLGQGKIWSAKNNAWFNIFMSFVMAVVCVLAVLIWVDGIVGIYAPYETIREELKPVILIYCFALCADMMNGTLNTVLRLSGKVFLVFRIMFMVYTVTWTTLSYFGTLFGWDVQWFIITYVASS
jgi:Na+-driven multidrug efflux pump